MAWIRALAAAALLFTACSSGDPTPSTAAPARLTARVVATRAHDPSAFTEGLVFVGRDRLFESSGGYGASEVREVDPDSGAVRRRAALPDEWFGEGLAAHDDELVQLTWKEGRARSWRVADLAPAGERTYAGEGWGLADDPAGDRWVQGDGSSRLTFRDREFAETGALDVRRSGRPVDDLNELEVVGRHDWANVWRSDELVRIDLRTGRVAAVVDLAALGPDTEDPEAVLNGIAHRQGDPPDRLWVTGKRWPAMYEIEVS